MAKRLSEKEKTEIVNLFSLGKSLNELAVIFDCSKLTISRNLKKILGEDKYKELINTNNKEKENLEKSTNDYLEQETPIYDSFMEIAPLNYEIDHDNQKDLSSITIKEIDFPKIVYMIVNQKIELEIKYLKDFPDWQFLSQEELKRKTIEIYSDIKVAKRLCNKEQKVIKVPNSNIFKIVAPILLSRGITRIISDDKLIAL